MKIDLHKIASAIIRFGTPVVLAAVAHKVATGKLDVKGAVITAVKDAVADRLAPVAGKAAIHDAFGIGA